MCIRDRYTTLYNSRAPRDAVSALYYTAKRPRGDVWWTNAVLMGVQTGDAFGKNFVEAARLAPGDGWRARLVGALAHAALPTAWLPIVAEVAGVPADLPKLKKFVGRYRNVLQCEGGKAVTQLVAQQPEASKIFDALREAKTQRVLNWRNKPLAEACVATFAHDEQVNALAVSKTRIVGGARKAVHVYDAESEELLGKLEGASAVQSVAVFEGDDGKGWIAAGFQDGTIKVWDAGQPFHLSPCHLSLPLMPFLLASQILWSSRQPKRAPTVITSTPSPSLRMVLRLSLDQMTRRSKSGTQVSRFTFRHATCPCL